MLQVLARVSSFLLITATILHSAGVDADLCKDIDEQNVEDDLYTSATPSGGVHAGIYFKDLTATDLPGCLVACCLRETCNVVFFSQGECFLITCNVTDPHACDPEPRTGDKFVNTYMMQVRTLDETSALSSKQTSTKRPDLTHSKDGGFLDTAHIASECDPSNPQSCDAHEECQFVLSDELVGYQCQCIDGYAPDPLSRTCVEVDFTTAQQRLKSRPLDYTCTFGLLETCLHHETCELHSSRSRQGTCECSKGYIRDPDSGWCIKDAGDDSLSSSSSPAPTTTTVSVAATEVKSSEDKVESSSSSSSTTTTTPSTTAHAGAESSSTITTKPTVASLITTTTEGRTTTTTRGFTGGSSLNITSTMTTSLGGLATTEKSVVPLVVSAGGNREIQLPQDEVTLSAYALPADPENAYNYVWTLTRQPPGDQVGQMQDINTSTPKMSHLVAGLYTFKVAVSADGKYGESYVNITVLPPKRMNAPPVAVAKPPSQSVNQPNDVVLDGSSSTDDDKIVQYKWEQVSGPLNSKNIEDEELQKAMLVLKGLSPGNYQFKLTVTDSDGADNSTFANVTVIKEIDYPPKANAGSNVILSLPQNSIILNGNASTDDKGIVSYEWIKMSDDKLTADMKGVRTPYVQLENLEEGDYTFMLKVTDSGNQVDTADVHVFVKPEHNKPPVAKVGKDRTVFLPVDATTLDGSNSTDDTKVTSYKWTQISGPGTVNIDNADRAVATASKLAVGEYKFKLMVEDEEGLQSFATLTVAVKENENHPPKANAGGDQVIDLPTSLVTLDGSKSTDDRGIVSYLWTRDDKSLAAGNILNESEHQAVLQLTNLVAGRYIFTLKVLDSEGLKSTDSASIIVRPDIHEDDMVELEIDGDLSSFSYANKKRLENQLALLLHMGAQDGEIKVIIEHLTNLKPSGPMSAQFYVTSSVGEIHEVKPGTEVVASLRKKLKSDADVLDFRVLNLDTLVCQNNCSGHGHCLSSDKRCICEAFWMENFFRVYLGDGQSNCDWSILYVIIITFTIVVTVAGVTWGLVCLCKRWYKTRPKKRHRYTLLHEMDDEKDDLELAPRGKKQTSSLMLSESEFTSDEETLFINNKKSNGHVKNGLVKPARSKVKT